MYKRKRSTCTMYTKGPYSTSIILEHIIRGFMQACLNVSIFIYMLALFYSNIYKLGNLARKITEVISPISKATWLWIIFKPSHQILLINRVCQKCDSILQLLIGSSVTAAVRSKLELGSFCAALSSSDIRFILCHPRCTASTYIAEPRISLCTSAADNNVKN